MTVARTILDQLGGGRFIVMTGAKNFIGDERSLTFKIGKNCNNINYVRIVYNRIPDHYNMEFYRASVSKKTGPQKKEVARYDGIFFDQLQPLFTKTTGMDTHL